MDTLKQNSYFFLILIVFISCFDSKNEKLQLCEKEENINFYNDSLRIYFYGKYEKKSLKKLTVKHIRSNKKITNFEFKNKDERNITISKNIALEANDSLVIVFNDMTKLELYNFRNIPHYGGKKNLGCYFGYCMLDNDTLFVRNGTITLK